MDIRPPYAPPRHTVRVAPTETLIELIRLIATDVYVVRSKLFEPFCMSVSK